jgi:hypothetical protein
VFDFALIDYRDSFETPMRMHADAAALFGWFETCRPGVIQQQERA